MRGLQEVVPIQDTLCSGIGAIERLDGNLIRFWLYVSQTPEDGGAPEKVVVAKIVGSGAGVPDAVLQIIASISDCAVARIGPLVPDMMKN